MRSDNGEQWVPDVIDLSAESDVGSLELGR